MTFEKMPFTKSEKENFEELKIQHWQTNKEVYLQQNI